MRGFIGRNGRAYSGDQRKAMFSRLTDLGNCSDRKSDQFYNINSRFAELPSSNLPAVIPKVSIGESLLTSTATSAGSAAGSMAVSEGIKGVTRASSDVGHVITGGLAEVTGAYDVNNLPEVGRSDILGKKKYQQRSLETVQDMFNNPLYYASPVGGMELAGKNISSQLQYLEETAPIYAVEEAAVGTVTRAEQIATPAVDTAALVAGAVAGSLVPDLSDTSDNGMGAPYMRTNSEFMMVPEDKYGFMSKDPKFLKDDGYIDVDKVRKLVKKEYPHADVDMDVKLLAPGDYTKFALKENPGRETEAVTSNGFYSPVYDAAFLEKDSNKLNTLRAMIHEMVHDMSDDGVNKDGDKRKYMLNEGYCDYVAKKIMIQEMNIPEKFVNKTIGYPDEVRQIESLVQLNGRRKVDDSFLVNHSLDGLKLS